MATLGIFVGEQYHPLFGGNIDGLATSTITAAPLKVFWFLMLLACGAFEAIGLKSLNLGPEYGTMAAGHTPGDFDFDPLRLKKNFEANGNYKEIQAKELNNGRLAMIAAAGIIGQELATGEKIFR